MKNFAEINRASTGAKKNFNLIERLWTDSHEKQSATRVHHGTKSRELPGNPRPLRYLCTTLALPLRYVAMIFAVLVMSIANIGTAWGGTTAPTGSAHTPGSVAAANLVTFAGKKYEVYFSNNASQSSLLVGSNTSATTQATSTSGWCNIGSSCGNNNNNIASAFTLDEFVSNVKGNNANKAIRVQSTAASEKNIVMVVSGYDSISVFAKSNDLTVYAEIWGGSSYGASSALTVGHTKNASSHYKRQFALDKTKQYRLTIAYGTSGSTNKDVVAFSLCYTPASGYTLTNAVSPAGYGTVSPSSVTSIPSGTATSSSTNTYTVNGTTVTATPAASTSAWTYAFSSWSNLPATVTAAATVTANFTRTGKSYTITLDKDGGSGGSATVSATYGSAMPSAGAAPTKSGFTFLGYYASKVGVGTQYYNATPASATNSDFTSATTIYAGWKVNAPSISFSEDLSNMVTITGTAGASIYYTTNGTDPTSSSTLYSAPFTINADKTIKAIAIKAGAQNSAVASLACTYNAPPTWYTLSYDANGGTGSMPSQEFVSGTTVYAGQNAGFTAPTGKIFSGWNTKSDGEGTSYAEGASFTLSGNTTLYAQWITASTSSTYCISMYNLNVSDQMKYFTYSGSSDIQILDLEVPDYKTNTNNFWVGNGGSWKSGDLGNKGASSANERLEDMCLKGNRGTKLGTGSQGVLARFFVYDNSTYNNLYIEFTPKQYSLIWGPDGSSWSPVKLYPSGCENEWTSEVVTLTSDQISSYNYYVGILKADNGVAYWYKSNTLSVGSMGTYNKRTDTWGGNVSTLSAGDKGFFRMWSDATSYDNWRCHFVPVYTLSYNANNGTGAPATVYVPSEGDESHRTVYVSTTEPTRTGYSFGGWATSSSRASAGTVDYVAGSAITLDADVELFAVWTCIIPDAPTVDKITVTPSCAGTGATFSANTTGIPSYVTWYWQTAADGTSTSYPASSDYTTATSAGSYTMYLRAKNTACGEWSNSASTPSKSVKVKTPVTISWNTAPADGYEGGSMTASVTTNYAAGVTYAVTAASPAGCVTINETSGAISYVAEGTATITATVTGAGADYCSTANVSQSISVAANKYTVTYAANGGSGSGPTDANYYDPDDEVTVLGKNMLSKSGYTFCGWSYNGYVYVEGDKFNITESATLTAVWNQNATTVTITNFATSNTNTSNNIPDDNSKYFYGYKGTVSDANALTLTSNDGNDRGQNSGVEMRLTYNKKMRVYANNTTNAAPATFTGVTAISFKWMFIASGNSGKTELTSSYTVKVGSTTVANAVSITGKTNDGYATVNLTGLANLSGYIEIVFGGSSSSYNVYIDDIAITYSTSTYKKVSFNKGSGPSTVSGLPGDRYVPSGSKISRPSTDPTAANYIFNGWVTTSGGSTAFDFANTTITTDKTIYAKWTAKTSPGSGTVSGTTSICSGSNTNVTLSTSVSGASYQLYKDNVASGDPKPGTGDALNWSVSAAGTYTVKAVETATHASGNMSGSATISIYTALTKTSDPTSSKSATVGVGCALDGLAYTGNANVACQWQSCTDDTPSSASNISDGGAYSNCTTPAMTFTPASAGTYYFRCVVSDDCGSSFNSDVVTVTAKVAPTVYSVSCSPSSPAHLCGETATISLSGSQSGINYQLYKNGVAEGDPKAGTDNAISWTGIDAAGTYTVKTVETSTYAEATMTGSVSISIMTPTSISMQPTTSVTGHDGVNFTLGSNLVGAGEGTLTYQWYSYTSSGGAGEATVGSATTTKTLTTSKSAGTYYYKVEVIGECGSVKSNMITVTVDNKHYLTYSNNNGSGAPSGGYYSPGSITLNSTTIPTRSGYVFLGWNTNNTGTGDMYQPGATYTMPATATTLYAAWGSPCFNVSDASKKTMPDGQPAGTVITGGGMINGTITGGTLTYTGTDAAGLNGNAKGLIFNNDNDELTVNITDGMLQEGTVIVIGSYGTASSSSHTNGLKVSGNNMSPATVVSSTSNNSISQRYVVADGDGIKGTSSFTIRRVASTDQMMLNTISVAGCQSCTGITPSLSYDHTTLYAFGGSPSTATPTLTGNTGGGAVTYTSSNSNVVTVNASTGVVTGVGAGTATVSATIEPIDDYCGAIVSANFTVPALVQQTINLNSAWSTVPNMTFPGDQTSTLTRNANIAATGYSIDESNNKSGLSSKITGVPSSTSKNDSYYMSLKFNTPSYGVRLTNVIVPIQPITNTASAIVTVSDGTTTVTSNEEADIAASSTKTCTFTITPTTFAAGKTITVKIFVYDQSGNKGFRLSSPILVSGSAITDAFEFTGDGANTNWNTAANWNWGVPPGINNDVVIKKPATVNVTNAKAKSIVLDQSDSNTGKLDINAGKELIVATTVRKTTDGETLTATGENDIHIGSTSALGLGALVMGEHDGTNNATVYFATKSHGSKGSTASVSQYVGTPFCNNPAMLYQFYNSWMYKLNDAGDNWIRVNGNNTLEAFRGYAVISADPAGHVYDMSGTLCSSNDVEDKALNYNGSSNTENMLANSWMAPIKIHEFNASTDFTNADATIYIFNSGSPEDYENNSGASSYGDLAGQYHSYTVNTAAATDVIPAMQAFSVYATGSGAKITLDHSRLVYDPAAAGTITPVANKVQRRAKVSDDPMTLMGIRVMGSQGWADAVRIYMREDFEQGFENGWDGRKMFGETAAPQLYAITPDGKMTINCIPTFEGTVLGFQAGTDDNNYTFSFQYEGAETLYLNDLKEEQSTLISSENSYQFFTETGDPEARFIISATPYGAPEIATGVENTVQGTDVRKVIINDKMYIIRGGRMYSADGQMVR